MPPLLAAEGLSKSFHRRGRGRAARWAVEDVSLDVSSGRTLAIVGESGAGKSTVGRILARLVEPDSGSVRLDGTDLLALRPRALRSFRRAIQMVFQDPYTSLDPLQAIGSALEEPLILQGTLTRAERRERRLELLETVGLRPSLLDRRPPELSGGQLQRVSIARALALNPKVLVCDEAISALDVSIAAQIINLLLDLQESMGLGMVFISHDMRSVRAVADDVLVMRDGRVVERGPADEVFGNPSDPYVRRLLEAVPGQKVDRLTG